MFLLHISLPTLKGSSFGLREIGNIQSQNQHCIGGGEGIRTPDPRVANAVLCQLSYAPDKQ